MKNAFVIVSSLVALSPAFAAASMPDIICPRMTLGAPSADQSKIVGSTVAIFLTNRSARPMTAVVEGLDHVYPPGTALRMNFQDVFGRGTEPDGTVIYVEPGKGDGTLQDYCGPKANVLVQDARKKAIYCGECEVY